MILRLSVGESHWEHPELAKATTTDGMDVRSRLIAQLSGRAAPTRQVRIGSFSRFAPLPMDDASGADGICNIRILRRGILMLGHGADHRAGRLQACSRRARDAAEPRPSLEPAVDSRHGIILRSRQGHEPTSSRAAPIGPNLSRFWMSISFRITHPRLLSM